jgi:hypothetical protein
MISTKNFYTKLKPIKSSIRKLLDDKDKFKRVPDDWYIIITDIENSTDHFERKHYQDINLIAVSTVSVIVNEAKKEKTSAPFIYGGDGATFIIPPQLLSECSGKLATIRDHSEKNFNMNLRVCIIPVKTIRKEGFPIYVAKLAISDNYNQVIFLGNGIQHAESLMRHSKEFFLSDDAEKLPVDLTGLECEWTSIFPPRLGDEVISLIVQPSDNSNSEEIFRLILKEIKNNYGSFEQRHPIHAKAYTQTTNFKTLVSASKLRYGKYNPTYLFASIIKNYLKNFKTEIQIFLQDLFSSSFAEMSTSTDTLKIDYCLKTIFVGSPDKRKKFEKFLNTLEKKKEIVYGLSVSSSSVMTCYIKDTEDTHVRFLDGYGGGYTLAAIKFKKKMRKLERKIKKK